MHLRLSPLRVRNAVPVHQVVAIVFVAAQCYGNVADGQLTDTRRACSFPRPHHDVRRHAGFVLGTNVKAGFAAGRVDVRDYNVLVGYKAKDFTAAVATENKLSKLVAAYHQVVSPSVTAAAVAKLPTAFKASVPAFDVEVGLAYKLAPDTVVHGKVNQAGKVSVSYAQQVSSLTKITFAGEVDAANISSDDHKFGVVLNLTA